MQIFWLINFTELFGSFNFEGFRKKAFKVKYIYIERDKKDCDIGILNLCIGTLA